MKKQMKKIEVGKVKFDESIYPRIQPNWQTTYDYAQSMKTGAKFPPIGVALHRGQFVLIDGYFFN